MFLMRKQYLVLSLGKIERKKNLNLVCQPDQIQD